MTAAAGPTPPAAAPPAAGPPPGYPAPYGPPPGYPPPPYYMPPMRRATAGPMIEDTFGVFGKDLVIYLVVFAVFAAVVAGISMLLTYLAFGVPEPSIGFSTNLIQAFGPNALGAYLALALLDGVINAIIGAIVTATIVYFAVQRYRGAAITLRQAFDEGVKRLLSVLVAGIIVQVAVTALIVLPATVILFGAFSLDLGLIGFGCLALLLAGMLAVFLIVVWSLYAPAIMIEGQGAVASLSRSWQLTKGHRVSIAVAGFVVLLVAGLVEAAVLFGFGLAGGVVLVAIGTIIGTAITGAWAWIFVSVAYDLIVKEPQPAMWPPPYMGPAPMPPSPPPSPPPS